LPFTSQVAFFVESNSTVTSLAFNSTTSELSFTVSSPSNTSGYVKATIAKSIVPNAEKIKICLDEEALNYSLASKAEAWFLTFNYSHSIHKLNLFLGENEPDPSTFGVAVSPSNSEALSALTNASPENFELWITLICIGALAIVLIGVTLRKRK
jgi:hypothetical protein